MPFCEEKKGRYYQDIMLRQYMFDMHDDFRIGDVLRLVQDTSSRHLEDIGWGYEKLMKSGYVYLLVYLKVKFYKKFKLWNKARVYVWPKSNIGARSYRDAIFLDENGELMAEASTVWVLADYKNHKIVPPENSPLNLTLVDDIPLKIGNAKKIRMPKDLIETGSRLSVFTDLDPNNHVNNTKYSDIFMDYAAIGVQKCGIMDQVDFYKKYYLEEFDINYRSEVFLNEDLTIYTSAIKEEDASIKVYLRGSVEEKNNFDCVGIFKNR